MRLPVKNPFVVILNPEISVRLTGELTISIILVFLKIPEF
jgi:hypothetical protein